MIPDPIFYLAIDCPNKDNISYHLEDIAKWGGVIMALVSIVIVSSKNNHTPRTKVMEYTP